MRTQINIWGKKIMAFSKKAEGTTKGKKHFGIFFLFLHIMTGALLSPSLKAATIYPSDSYNWIFLEGKAITFVVYGSAGVTYTVKDYWGNSKASGSVTTSSGSVTLDLVTANYPMGWYEISVSDAQGTQTAGFGVVKDRQGAALPKAGKIGVDAFLNWQLWGTNEYLMAPCAKAIAEAGIPWVRERITWRDTETASGTYNWLGYDKGINALYLEGLYVSQVFHDTPAWSRTSTTTLSTTDDLRSLYTWIKKTQQHYANKIHAWEIWNEPEYATQTDWSDLAERYAALQKAGYWGVKDADSTVKVLMSSMSTYPGISKKTDAFSYHAFQSKLTDYMDAFNFHMYNTPEDYNTALTSFNSRLTQSGGAIRPPWLTETGIFITPTVGTGTTELDKTAAQTQARYVGPAIARALAAGVEKVFYYCLISNIQSSYQFGMMKSDLTPYPSFVALSAASNILGEATYLGEYPAPSGAKALLFNTPNGKVLAAWSSSAATLPIAATSSLTLKTLFGATYSSVALTNGSASVSIGPDMIYISATDFTGTITAPNWATTASAATNQSRVILEGITSLKKDINGDAYILSDRVPFTYTVNVYNLDQSQSKTTAVSLYLPTGWSATPSSVTVTLASMTKGTASFTVTPGKSVSFDTVGQIAATATGCAPSTSSYILDANTATPTSSLPISITPSTRWTPYISAGGTNTISNITGGIKIDATFTGAADRWVFPINTFTPALDLSAYDGVSFEVKTNSTNANAKVYLQFTNQVGSTLYKDSRPMSTTKTKYVILFRDLAPLATNSIKQILAGTGGGVTANQISIEITNMKAVSFK
jgi:hypothetical protein